MDRAGIILAAGAGKRMRSGIPKVMHEIAARPMLGYVIAAMQDAGIGQIITIRGPGAEAVGDYAISRGAKVAVQEEQLGTGHAAGCAESALRDFSGLVLIANGDMPLISANTLNRAFSAAQETGLAIVAFRTQVPAAYGRVVINGAGDLDRIVEAQDASEAELDINLCNAGIMVARAASFFRWVAQLENNNNQREFYLTDVPAIAHREGIRCAVLEAPEEEMLGVNDRRELADAEAEIQRRLRASASRGGVAMTAPETVFFSFDTIVEPDAQIEPFVFMGPGVRVRGQAKIRAFSYLEGCIIESGAVVGPYSRLRPGTSIGEQARIGNFVEIKNSRVDEGAKANHLSYLGDAHVGPGANIGAGTITCNYDGFEKRQTRVGAGAFVGSNTALIAPVDIGDGAIVGAGSVITEDVEANALGIARAEQKQLKRWAADFRARKTTPTAKKGT